MILSFVPVSFINISLIIINSGFISATSDELREQFLELFILGEKDNYSKKLFNSWEVLQANITCMFLYGNIFILGVDIGNVRIWFVYFFLSTLTKHFSDLFLLCAIVENF